MSKYLELFLGEVGDLTEKTKLENKPYVSYSTKLGKVVYTVVPPKDPVVEGPADNEIWYTTVGLVKTDVNNEDMFSASIISNVYDKKGVIKFDNELIDIYDGSMYTAAFANLADDKTFKLTSVYFPEKLNSIGRTTFMGQNYITKIQLPQSITRIGGSAFYDCMYISEIIFTGTKEQWNNISIEYNAFNRYHNDITIRCSDGNIVWEKIDLPVGQ